jgi:hypothetical protein
MPEIACVMIDGDRRYEVECGTAAWEASLAWAKFHGLDPMGIPFGSEVIRDVPNRRIVFTAFVKDGPNIADIVMDGLEPLTVRRVEQGEAPPLPFPPEVTGS